MSSLVSSPLVCNFSSDVFHLCGRSRKHFVYVRSGIKYQFRKKNEYSMCVCVCMNIIDLG